MECSRFVRVALLPAAISLLTACGGGGGSSDSTVDPVSASYSGSTQPIDLSAQPDSVAAQSIKTVVSSDTTGGVDGYLYYDPTTSVKSKSDPTAVLSMGLPGDPAGHMLALASTGSARATSVQPFPCYNGEGSYTETTTDKSISVTYNQCSDAMGDVANGSISMTFTDQSKTTTQVSGSAVASYNVTVTGTHTAKIYGGVGLDMIINLDSNQSVTDITMRMHGNSLYAQDGQSEMLLTNFSTSVSIDSAENFSETANYTIASTDIGGQVTISTPVTLTGNFYNSPYPTGGQILVSGANGTKVQLTAQTDGTVYVQYDLDGTPGFESPGQYVLWTDLGQTTP